MKKKIVLIGVVGIILIGYFVTHINIGTRDNYFTQGIRYIIPENVKQNLKETIFIFRNQNRLKKQLADMHRIVADQKALLFYRGVQLSKKAYQHEETIREKKLPISFSRVEESNLKINDENVLFEKFRTYDLITGKYHLVGGSSYIDYYENKLFIASATGIFGFVDVDKFNNNYLQFTTIGSNIKEIINYDSFSSFYQSGMFGIKDLLIHKNKLYISYTNQLKKDCFNTSIFVSDISLTQLEFEKFFTPEICVKPNNTYGEFWAGQSGGRMSPYKKNKLLFTAGEYRFRDHAQDKLNVMGKIIEINIESKEFKIVSMGHRNPQGLYYDISSDIIFSTEHGPWNGDEINIHVSPEGNINNYGWPISSYGEHYSFDLGKTEENKAKYEKAPLHKSHKKYGFVEPLKYFIPSIGISQLVLVSKKFIDSEDRMLLIGSMPAKKLVSIKLDKNNKIIYEENIDVGERIRDMIYVEDVNKIFLFLENTASIGVLSKSN